MLNTHPRIRSNFAPESYPLKKSKAGPKNSPDAITIGGSQYSIGVKDLPLVSRQNEGEWQPIKSFEDVVSTIKAASTPEAKVEIGTWEDSYRWGLYRDGTIQDSEVTELWDDKGWDSYRYAEDYNNGSYYKVVVQPQEAYLANERYSRARLQVPTVPTRHTV